MPDSDFNTQMEAMKLLVDLSKQRSQMSATRSYMNAERTLSVWIRTALAAMIFGIAIDRFGLLLHEETEGLKINLSHFDKVDHLMGFALVIYSIVMSLFCGIRFLAYCREYKKDFTFPAYHRSWLPAVYAFAVVFFGLALLFLLIWI